MSADQARGGPDCNPFTNSTCEAQTSSTAVTSSVPTIPTSTNSLAASDAADTGRSLSGGTLAGIVVGFVVAFALLAGFGILWWRRRQNSPVGSEKEQSEIENWDKAELDSNTTPPVEMMGYRDCTELPAAWRTLNELPGSPKDPSELSAG